MLGSGVNPAFTLPGGLKVADAIRKVPFVVSAANLPDETTALAHLVLPDTHWLESWGDYSPREGVTGLMQPTMQPIRDSRAFGDVLLAVGRTVLGTEEGKGPLPWASYEQFVKAAWEPTVKGRWAETLSQGGVWQDVAPAAVTPKIERVDVGAADARGRGRRASRCSRIPSFRFYDGRSASRSWLQETPDTMTQAVWDPWVEINTETATKLGIRQGDVVKVTSPHGAIEVPAYLSASIHPRAVAIPIGHRYAPYHLRLKYVAAPSGADEPDGPAAGRRPRRPPARPTFLSVRVTLAKTGARRPLAILQATHDQDDRELARHVDLKTARAEALKGKPGEHELPTHVHGPAVPDLPLGHVRRRRRLHRLPGVRGGLPGGEQRPHRRQGRGRLRAAGAVAAHRALGGGPAGPAAPGVPADVLPALRGRAVRAGLPGVRRLPHGRGAQRAGLQPLRRARGTAATTARTTCAASTGGTTRSRRRWRCSSIPT